MELIVDVGHDAVVTDVVFEVEPAATFGDLADSVRFLHEVPHGGTFRIARTGQMPRRDDRVADVDVRSGDRLHLIDSVNAAFSVTPEAYGATLVVTDESGASSEHPLRYGDSTIGRDLDNDVVIKDPQFSRHHARISVTDVLSIADLGSKNGVRIGEAAISTPTVFRPEQVLRVGGIGLKVTDHRRAREALAHHNRIEFNRPPRVTRAFDGADVELPAPPDKPRRQRIPMISSVLPVIVALVIWRLFPSLGLITVAFMMMSPILAIGSYLEAKRNGKYDYRDQVAEHRERIAELVEELEQRRQLEVRSRFFESPAAGEMVGFARSLSDRLWERAPDDADFVTVRVGTARLPSRTRIRLAQGGARELRKEMEEVPGRFALLDDVPLAVSFDAVSGIGLSGPMAATRSLARSLILQTVSLQSPTELAVVALVGEQSVPEWEFLKWLPHSRTLGGSQLASTSHHALALVDSLLARVPETPGGMIGDQRPPMPIPAFLVVIDESCPLERRRLVPLLEAGRDIGVLFVWVASARHRLPKACGAVVDIDPDHTVARTGFTRSGLTVEPTRWEGMSLDDATALARELTPIIDVTGRVSDDSEIPSRVSFPELYGGPEILDRPSALGELWAQREAPTSEQSGLRVVVGMQSGAPFSLDIRQDGPHALVAGTTGAGKSEFLQSLIVGLATMHSPERVTFLLVDYKGGAAFKECVALPHTVGMVTDLDRNEVRRALVSLNAELHHRELLLQEADAKDLIEMERKGHPKTPPSLLIVVDEFAALAKEVPEFVDGVVDVALRGRSLGLHLVLATQRPAGVITGQITANTNLRVALRMAAEEESTDVVGSPVAAHIERRYPGRAVARIGPQELVGFQSVYVGGHTLPDVHAPMVGVRLFGFDHDTAVAEEHRAPIPADHPSDLQRLVTTHQAAFDASGLRSPRRPWLPSLAHSYSLGMLPAPTSDEAILLGVSDLPARQIQSLAYFRPDTDGGLIVLGAGGSGKTVALRSLAVSAGLAAERSGEPVEVYALDFAGRGLDVLEDLPHVGSVINGDDTERVTRLLRSLRERIERRSVDFAAVRASSLPEYRRNRPGAPDRARIIVLLDSYPGFASLHEKIEAGRWLDAFARLVADGRQFGVHFVVTGDRRLAIPSSVFNSIPRRVVLRLSSDDEYANAGETAGILSGTSPPGRAIIDGTEVQIGVLGGSGGGERQAAEIAALAGRLAAAGVRPAPPVGTLPLEIRRAALGVAPAAESLVIGVGDTELAPLLLPLDQGHVVVAGPARSGRTSTLATISQSAAAAGFPLFHLHVRPTPLSSATFWAKTARGGPDGAVLLRRIVEVGERFGRRVLVVCDDMHELFDTEADDALVEVLRAARDLPITVVVATENQAGRRQYSGAMPDVRKDGVGMLLQPDTENDGDLLGVPLPRRTQRNWPEGRGYFVCRGTVELAQIALPDPLERV